jgi:hypothetical protein
MTSRQTQKEKRDRELYNLLPGERETIAAYQEHKDPITGEPLKPYAHMDHDHRTGLVRGLLNPMTNKVLVDDIAWLEKALEYLKEPPATVALGEEVYGLVGKAQRKRKMLYGPDKRERPMERHPRHD